METSIIGKTKPCLHVLYSRQKQAKKIHSLQPW